MSYILIIVESPSKCAKIQKYVGNKYKCIATAGHLRELNSLKNIDTKNNFHPTYTVIKSKQRYISNLLNCSKNASEILLASDDDREGESIAWHICMICKLSPITTKRIVFNEITKSALLSAIQTPSTIKLNLVYAQQARQILDILVGFKISPILWNSITCSRNTLLSAGRCQTPALRLIYDNYIENSKDNLEKIYSTIGYFTKLNIAFNLNKKYKTESVIKTFLEYSINYKHIYNKNDIKQISKPSSKPFTTSRLQQHVCSCLKVSPKIIDKSLQKLYEEGKITYIRTDSETYSLEFIETAISFIKDKYTEKYIDKNIKLLSVRQNKKNAQEAHEAIRPTDITIDNIDNLNDFYNLDKKIYKIIWTNTVESCMSDAILKQLTVKISAPENNYYKYIAEQVIEPGWLLVKGYEKTNKIYNYLVNLKSEHTIKYNKICSKLSISNQKQHYTESGLIKALEQKKIGRPSTFASLVDKIQQRGYVNRKNIPGVKIDCLDFRLQDKEICSMKLERTFNQEKNKLVINKLGIKVIEFLIENYDEIFNYEYTHKMENELDIIANGDKEWHTLCRDCLTLLNEVSKQFTNNKINIKIDEQHSYVIGKYGPVIKKTDGKKTTFIDVKSNIDIEKLKQNQYTLAEIINTDKYKRELGQYQNKTVILCIGKYGIYLDWDGIKINTKLDKNKFKDIRLEQVKDLLVNPICLKLSDEASIRNGKYGKYIYYKTDKMKRPKFIKLSKSLKNNCTVEQASRFLKNNHNIELNL